MFRAILIGALLASTPIHAQDLRALARVDMGTSYVRDNDKQVEMRLALTQAVPFRTTFFKDPMRLTIDFREVVFDPVVSQLDQSEYIADIRAGPIPDGWSRLVLELATPMGLDLAHMTTDPSTGQAVIDLRLASISAEDFASLASDSPVVAVVEAAPDVLPLIMIDPGHGGVDPGAERGGVKEADLMLLFARELRENLRRTGRFRVAMTREGDDFVSLPERVTMARSAGAAAFVSLHADALAEGRATGTTIYTLSDEASDQASAKLAERQNRKDLLAGVDLTAVDDQVALALMDLARKRTSPRTDRLADALVVELKQSLGKLHKRPRLKAGFSVLKAPDIPSVLVELGFMSSQSDLDRLQDPVWRAEASNGIIAGLDRWLAEEAVLNSSQ